MDQYTLQQDSSFESSSEKIGQRYTVSNPSAAINGNSFSTALIVPSEEKVLGFI